MEIAYLRQIISSLQNIDPFLILVFIFLITWIPALKGKFLIDDHEGVERFTDRFVVTKDPAGKIIKEEEIRGYEEDGKKYRNFQFNFALGFYQGILRFLRANIGKRFSVIGKNQKGHEVYGYVQDPSRHHLISLVIHLFNISLAYSFLKIILGGQLAFMSVLLFIVHPIACQCVAWISGIGYLLSLFFILITFNISARADNNFSFLIVGFTNFISTSALLSGFANFAMLGFLQKWYAFTASLLVSIYLLATWGKTIVHVRKQAFKEQNMDQSTKLNWRKPIVIIKTFCYYILLMIFPKSLGLFHVWGYHYDEKIERIDALFWGGILTLLGLGLLFYFGDFPVRFGVLWLFSYLILFSNIITAQQFVADRYAFISSLGYSIIVAYFLKDLPMLFYMIVGLYMMRTIMHIPTFQDDEALYRSNIFNFPKSEVAYGNLGVIMNANGRGNGAVDAWQTASKINNFYDVPHYNIYSMMKVSGMLEQAKEELKLCLNSKTVHFKDMWEKEMAQLEINLQKKREFDALNAEITKAVNEDRYNDIKPLKLKIAALQAPPCPNPPLPPISPA